MQTIDSPVHNERIYSVSEITSRLKDLLESSFAYLWISGEVSNCSRHSSGHTYFTLKDEGAQLRCVLFGSASKRIAVHPEDGLKIYAKGKLTVYEKYGQHELIVSAILPAGKGELYIAFNRLKERLAKEGLFDPARKKELPRFPSRVAVVTSPTGAAVRDIIRMAAKIYAGVEIVVFPVRVQGEGAKDEIASAVERLNTIGGFDVLIVSRGGGSIEDLWAFNEEVVARAIAASRIPVVSAVGHEIDFTIADFVADARAATPSTAPALVLADYADVKTKLRSLVGQAYSALARRIERDGQLLVGLKTHYGLRRIKDRVIENMRDIDEILLRAHREVAARTDAEGARLANLKGKIEALSPLATLDRGYSICFREDTRRAVRSYDEIDVGDRLRIRFARGGAISRVEERGKETV